jgi:hypothetical protein
MPNRIPPSPFVDVLGERWLKKERVLKDWAWSNSYQVKRSHRIEQSEEKYVALSCGHFIRWPDWVNGGKNRKRVRCHECGGPLPHTDGGSE